MRNGKGDIYMTRKEAVILITKKYPDRVIDKITETENFFLISMIRKKRTKSDFYINIEVDDFLKAIDKRTMKIFTYNPIIHGRMNKQ